MRENEEVLKRSFKSVPRNVENGENERKRNSTKKKKKSNAKMK